MNSSITYIDGTVYARFLPGYPDLMSTREVSIILRESTKTVCKHISSGELVAIKCGKKYMIPKPHLMSFLRMETTHPLDMPS